MCGIDVEHAYVVVRFSPPEWQKLSDGESPVAEAKLVDANVAYLGWLTDNLATMDPVHKERVVSVIA